MPSRLQVEREITYRNGKQVQGLQKDSSKRDFVSSLFSPVCYDLIYLEIVLPSLSQRLWQVEIEIDSREVFLFIAFCKCLQPLAVTHRRTRPKVKVSLQFCDHLANGLFDCLKMAPFTCLSSITPPHIRASSTSLSRAEANMALHKPVLSRACVHSAGDLARLGDPHGVWRG